MKLYRAVLILLFLFLSCGGSGGSDDGGNGGGGGDGGGNNKTHFMATFTQGDISVDYSPVSINTLIGFGEVSIFTFNIQGESFDMFFERPTEVPIEINLISDPLHPKGGANITFGLNNYVYTSGTVFITQMTNERVAGDFDFFAQSQIDDSVIHVTGSFNLPDGILAGQ